MDNSDIAIDPSLDSMVNSTPKPTTTRSSPRKNNNTKTTPTSAPKISISQSKNKKSAGVEVIQNSDGIDVVKETRKKNPNWSIEEDKQLCVAWLNTSRDSITGMGQKGANFLGTGAQLLHRPH
jgi:hypothetical protein